jgi:hypothetical protein
MRVTAAGEQHACAWQHGGAAGGEGNFLFLLLINNYKQQF